MANFRKGLTMHMTLSSDSHYGKKYGKCVDFLNDPFSTTG